MGREKEREGKCVKLWESWKKQFIEKKKNLRNVQSHKWVERNNKYFSFF